MTKVEEMQELIDRLNEASRAYYQENSEQMSNYEYDQMYDHLLDLEKETGIILSQSPTQKVGYELLTSLPKEAHAYPMLSLDKTKSREELKEWLEEHEGVLSYKLDGLTVVLTYDNGQLTKAVTRGNGTIGEVITPNAKQFKNLPLHIQYKGHLVVRGEAVITYSDFERINESLEAENQYKNPRNLCSGSVRQLNSEITRRRHVRFYAFTLVSVNEEVNHTTKSEDLEWMHHQGFECVSYIKVNEASLYDAIDTMAKGIETNDVGSDGLVLTYDDKPYSQSLGATSKFPRDTIAFKWQDALETTKLIEVFWSASRTGLINPVALFEPVELEGTTVSRASLHNISMMEKLELGIGDEISVYKANMIIPQVADNITRSHTIDIPSHCPVCEEETEVRRVNDVKVLYCMNPECPAKRIKQLAHFVSRNAMNIEGLSEATIEKLIEEHVIHEFSDLFRLDRKDVEEVILSLPGFGEKSYKNLLNSVEKSKEVKMANFIYALGINHVGLSNAKLLVKAYHANLENIMQASVEELVEVEGFGEVIAKSLYDYFHYEAHQEEIKHLLSFIHFTDVITQEKEQILEGQVFVITGSLEHFENRNVLKDVIEQLGGKVTGSVSAKTTYLINNDVESSSSKNKKAKSLDIPIISEETFIQMFHVNSTLQ